MDIVIIKVMVKVTDHGVLENFISHLVEYTYMYAYQIWSFYLLLFKIYF